jgi:hypothetical protein
MRESSDRDRAAELDTRRETPLLTRALYISRRASELRCNAGSTVLRAVSVSHDLGKPRRKMLLDRFLRQLVGGKPTLPTA